MPIDPTAAVRMMARRLWRAALALITIGATISLTATPAPGAAAPPDPRATIAEARAAPGIVARVEILLALLDRLPAAATPGWRAIVLDELGAVFVAEGDRRMAHRFYVEAWALQRRVGEPVDRIRARTLLADLHWRGGDYARALHHYDAIAALAAVTPDLPTRVRAELYNNRGLVYATLGDWKAAEGDLFRALATRSGDDRTGIATSLHNLAHARHLAGKAGAETLYRAALAIRRALDEPFAAARTANNLGDWLTAAGRAGEALPLLEAAAAAHADGGDRFAQAHILDSLANAWAALGRNELADTGYGMALATARRVGALELEYQVLAHLAERRIRNGRPGAAVALLKSAVDVAQGIRADLAGGGAGRQLGYTTRVSTVYRRLADLLLQQDLVFEAERVLALLQVQAVSEFLRAPSAAGRIPLTAPEAAAVDDLMRAVDGLADLGSAGAVDPTRPPAQELLQALERFEQALRVPPGGGETIVAADVLRYIEVIQDFAADDDLALITFDSQRLTRMFERFVAATRGHATPMAPGSIEGYDLPPHAAALYTAVLPDRLEVVLAAPVTPGVGAEPLLRHRVAVPAEAVAEAVAALRATLTSPHAVPASSAEILHGWLVAPFTAVLERLDIDELVVVPDGPLRLLPFAALRGADGGWLAERYRVSYATELSASRRLAALPRPLSVFAGAFGETDVTIGAARFRPLAFTTREVADLERGIPGVRAVVGPAFTPAATQAAAFGHDILHLATHAMFRDAAPNRSLVLFGNGEGVSLAAMRHWRLRQAELVVLSACETAVSADGETRQVVGFGALMQQKGAVAIASLWQVDDGGTATFMQRFYAHLQEPGTSVAGALAAAQRDLIAGRHGSGDGTITPRGLVPLDQPARDGTRYGHPYYWAPFILMGVEAPG